MLDIVLLWMWLSHLTCSSTFDNPTQCPRCTSRHLNTLEHLSVGSQDLVFQVPKLLLNRGLRLLSHLTSESPCCCGFYTQLCCPLGLISSSQTLEVLTAFHCRQLIEGSQYHAEPGSTSNLVIPRHKSHSHTRRAEGRYLLTARSPVSR